MSHFLFEPWQEPQQKLINHFYKSHKQNVSCHKLDSIYVARHVENEHINAPIIAVTFIRELQTSADEHLYLLRSLYVDPQYRNQGIAKQLLQRLLQDTHPPLTVVCDSNLTGLYTKLGFHISPAEQAVNSAYLNKFIQQQKVILTNT